MIHRSLDRNIFFGVAGGISEVTGIKVSWVRLALILSQLFLWSWTWAAYLVAVVLLPERNEATWQEDLSPRTKEFLRRRRFQRRRVL
jgi:phage shock protein PspC (stress-responsive transcriptional regulator)